MRCYETVPQARKRASDEQLKIQSGLKKKKDHVGNFEYYESIIDFNKLKSLAASWTDETKVIWKHVGTECLKVKDKPVRNIGQIVQN